MLLADVAWRLGPRALTLYGWHRAQRLAGLPQRRLREGAWPAAQPGVLGPAPLPPAPALPSSARERVRAALDALPPAAWHGPFAAEADALGLDLFRPGDVRPVWEANRLAWLPLLVQAGRLWPEEGHHAAAEARLAAWCAANPPYRGPNWACGQEAALRALHLALALLLAGRERAPPAAARAFLQVHARRIAATGAYARAQDNNHSISEPAGLLACGWLLEDAALARHAAADLAAALRRLVAPDGGFAQVSTGYHRLLLDTLAVVELLRRRLGRPPLPAPFADRAAAAARWLARLVAADGALPALGHQDGSAFADLALGGPADARGSAERAMRLFTGSSAGFPGEPGCRWLDLPESRPFPRPAAWTASGTRGWEAAEARALLRTGPLRFRPGQADLLHLDLWDGTHPVLADAGTGAYNPPAGERWWLDYFPAARAHNTILFDEREPMPRLSRFLLARWPRLAARPHGAALRDAHGNRHARDVRPEGRCWTIADEVAGPFRSLALRWRLGPGEWRLLADGAEGPARLRLGGDAPLRLSLEEGWESPAYGVVRPCRVLVARAAAPVSRIVTQVLLP
ncbi:heparinase II/III family protein [Roseomonas sp. E05]|uniref:heparinase II/III domain-containing protein n=1 Tax=Roseomonas sp. E05 TaxID=3046310 RepID=UPI0024BACC75|nr:heparinase II/III family protein [Roseomonas sp. E05]MDJ0387669.1 heparinase II/III family protein [Roseomonas sp. E05]